MKKIKLVNKDSVKSLEKAIKKTKDEKYKLRLRGILLVKKNPEKERSKIAEDLVVSRRTLNGWIKIYNEKGKTALKTKRTGRPKGKSKWEESIFKDLAKEIDKSDKFWTIKLMQNWLKNEKKVEIPSQSIWYRITQLGYSHKSSRPYPYKGDKKEQKEFKKTKFWKK